MDEIDFYRFIDDDFFYRLKDNDFTKFKITKIENEVCFCESDKQNINIPIDIYNFGYTLQIGDEIYLSKMVLFELKHSCPFLYIGAINEMYGREITHPFQQDLIFVRSISGKDYVLKKFYG